MPSSRASSARAAELGSPTSNSPVLIPPWTISALREGPNRDFYLKKRGEGLKHVQALIALARRRVDVLWALLRDNPSSNASHPACRPVDNFIENPPIDMSGGGGLSVA